MQFKNPEILFFLFLLLIPLFIHLFQLQKFKTEAFTNVKFLKQIELETRKSSRLKKLLILLTRMLAFTALIIAFSGPYIDRNKGLLKRKNIYYIDNSLSLQAKGTNGMEQLQYLKNTLLDQISVIEGNIDLITNDEKMNYLDPEVFKRELMELDFSPVKPDINRILLQINNDNNNLNNTLINVYLISDFQNINKELDTSLISESFDYSLLSPAKNPVENISLDTVWIAKNDGKQITLKARLSSLRMTMNDLTVSLDLDEELYGKTTVNLTAGQSSEVEFLIPVTAADQGLISLTDHRLNFDNSLYFRLPQQTQKKVLIIGNKNKFLERIYTRDEFELNRSTYELLDQRLIPQQSLIILSELSQISRPLIQNLKNFVQNNGNLVIIPPADLEKNTYNDLFNAFGDGVILRKFDENKSVNKIHYDHPFFEGVFEKEVYNFQYPIITEGFVSSFNRAATLLEFEDHSDFITEIQFQDNKVYWISAPLSAPESNFINSPLIVPIFYKFSVQHKNERAIYLTLGTVNEISLETEISGESPVVMANKEIEFIPEQSRSSDRIRISTDEFPDKPGIYKIQDKGKLLERVAFNYNREESQLNFKDMTVLSDQYDNMRSYNSLDKAFQDEYERNNNKELWQLFIIFALVFLILEILLQRLVKN